jgi:SSS family transporter
MGHIDPVIAGVFIAVYVLLQIGVGIWFSRNVKSEADYFLAGRRLGLLPIMLSVFATWFGAETVMGSSAAIAQEGLSGARAEPFGYALALVGMAIFIAAAFRERGYTTLADFFRERFGPHAEFACAVIMVPISIIWAAAQLVALAAILNAAIGAPIGVTLIIATAIVIIYTAFGGLMGDVATDVVQSLVLIAGLVLVFFTLANHFGGVGGMIAQIRPEQLQLLGEGENWVDRIDAWAIPILGSLVAQEAISRFLAAKSPDLARKACFGAAGIYLAVGAIPVLIGLAGAHEFAALGDDYLPAMARELLPPVMFLIFAGALLSAILSTVDSNILSVSSLVSINLLQRLHKTASDATRLRVARIATIGAGLCAYAIAASGQSIYQLIELTSAFGQAGVLVAVVIGLRSQFGGEKAALAAMIGCVVANLYTLILWPLQQLMQGVGDAPPLYLGAAWTAIAAGEGPGYSGYFLLSLVVSALAYALAARFDRPRSAVPVEPAA